jgi:hypothetical protein
MKLAPVAWTLAAVVLLGSVAARAQSLGDLAKKGATKAYTNNDLKKYPASTAPAPGTDPAPPPPVAAPGDQPPGAGGAKPDAAKPGADPAKPAGQEEQKDEAYWRGRLTAAQSKLERDQQFLEALQAQVNSLTNDFYARDDPAQRAVLWTQRTKALAEMERLKTEIAEGNKAIANIREEARREGVPPGWLR